MQRIILSVALITFTIGGLAFGATSAFFNDTEQSAANAFTAGDVDLKIDNESYYNGFFNEGTSWLEDDLDGNDYKFFDFGDLKPGDYGEDTISIHVDTNDAYLCANVTLTSNNENTCNEPEALEDASCGVVDDSLGAGLGELADLVEFVWWADDGDNVLEDDEDVISEGTLGALEVGDTYPLTLADSSKNIWNALDAGGPVDGNTTYYIGKAWCFGDISSQPVPQDDETNVMSPAGDNNDDDTEGSPEDGGITCNGEPLGNSSQTDSLTADIAFSAVQSRHNPKYICEQPRPRTTLTLVKQVFNSGPFNELPIAWTLSADGVTTDLSGQSGTPSVTNAAVAPGAYNLGETGPQGYTASNWSCVGGTQNDADTVTIAEGQNVTCTVTNYVQCTPELRYADAVVTSDIGALKNGGSVLANRSNPALALGAPQSAGTPFDNPVVSGSFFSLGFDENDDDLEGGWGIFEFTDNYIVDGPGNDIRAWEVTGGTSYPVEKIKIEVSQDGTNWFVVAATLNRDSEADLADSGLTWAKYIRVTDVSDQSDTGYPADADGYDLDAISALTCASNLPSTNPVI